MISPQEAAFRRAYEEWSADPVKAIDGGAIIKDISASLEVVQKNLAPLMTVRYQTGTTKDEQTIERWHEGMDWLVQRKVRDARRIVQTGRHQVEARALLNAAVKLKEAWAAYRKLVGL
jgi:hypothetical protein